MPNSWQPNQQPGYGMVPRYASSMSLVSFTSTVACSWLMEHPVNCPGSEFAPRSWQQGRTAAVEDVIPQTIGSIPTNVVTVYKVDYQYIINIYPTRSHYVSVYFSILQIPFNLILFSLYPHIISPFPELSENSRCVSAGYVFPNLWGSWPHGKDPAPIVGPSHKIIWGRFLRSCWVLLRRNSLSCDLRVEHLWRPATLPQRPLQTIWQHRVCPLNLDSKFCDMWTVQFLKATRISRAFRSTTWLRKLFSAPCGATTNIWSKCSWIVRNQCVCPSNTSITPIGLETHFSLAR